jgi:hypothetical protein
MRARGERGQAVPLVLLVVAVAAGAMLLVGALGGRALARAQAQTAADAAALAGAAEGPAAAQELARRNGSASASVDGGVGDATVTVRLGGLMAVARAQGPPPVVGDGVDGLQPVLLEALARAGALLGRTVPISSGFRTRAEQEALWAARATNPYPVARPGTSRHERGMAVDVPRSFVTTLRAVAARVGLCQPLPESDPVHFEPCRRSELT